MSSRGSIMGRCRMMLGSGLFRRCGVEMASLVLLLPDGLGSFGGGVSFSLLVFFSFVGNFTFLNPFIFFLFFYFLFTIFFLSFGCFYLLYFIARLSCTVYLCLCLCPN